MLQSSTSEAEAGGLEQGQSGLHSKALSYINNNKVKGETKLVSSSNKIRWTASFLAETPGTRTRWNDIFSMLDKKETHANLKLYTSKEQSSKVIKELKNSDKTETGENLSLLPWHFRQKMLSPVIGSWVEKKIITDPRTGKCRVNVGLLGRKQCQ